MSISGRGNPVSGYTAVLIGSVAVGAIVSVGEVLVSPVESSPPPPPPHAASVSDTTITMAVTSENLCELFDILHLPQ